MDPIINSLLDTDQYKLTMFQAVFHQFPSAYVRYKFKCRNKGITFTEEQADEINWQIKHLCELRFTEDELKYLGNLRFIKPDFVDLLRIFKLQTRYVNVSCYDGELEITITGPWWQTMLFEVPVLAIVNEVYFYVNTPPEYWDALNVGERKLREKIDLVKTEPDFKFIDFGTRRRYSRSWHDKIMADLVYSQNFVGTSNVFFARKYGTTARGTHAHEWFQGCQALTRVRDSQKFALQKWADEYRGDLGIALSDTLGIDAFLRDFDPYFAKLFDGVRHDSGDPIVWVDKVINHYKQFSIDPMTKTAVFSDGLTFPKAIEIMKYCQGKIKPMFGIGTNLTNDLVRVPLNIVMKITHCNGIPVAKISDSGGKGMCEDPKYLEYLKNQFNIGEIK